MILGGATVTTIPRIDHGRRLAVVVDRYPGAKLCARITTRPLATALRSVIPATQANPRGRP